MIGCTGSACGNSAATIDAVKPLTLSGSNTEKINCANVTITIRFTGKITSNIRTNIAAANAPIKANERPRKRVYRPGELAPHTVIVMGATSTARVVRFQARQKAGLIVVSVVVDQTKFADALEEIGLPLRSDHRDEIEIAVQRLIDEFCFGEIT